MNFLFQTLLYCFFYFGHALASQEAGLIDDTRSIYYYKLWNVRAAQDDRDKNKCVPSSICFYIDQGEGKKPSFYEKVPWNELGSPTQAEIIAVLIIARKKAKIPKSAKVVEYPYSMDY